MRGLTARLFIARLSMVPVGMPTISLRPFIPAANWIVKVAWFEISTS